MVMLFTEELILLFMLCRRFLNSFGCAMKHPIFFKKQLSLSRLKSMFFIGYLDNEALELARITIEQLSKPVSTTTVFTGVNQEYSQYMGISEQTPFVIGASDGVLSNLGVDAIEPGVVAVTIGTSGAIRTLSE